LIKKEIAKIYYNNLLSNEQALTYLKNRKINVSTVKKYKLGYCDKNIAHRTLNNKYTQEQLSHTGMFYKSQDLMNDRIVFPMFQGTEVVFFTSRYIGHLTKVPPHLHQRGKIELPYNYNSIKKDNVIIVESPIDCLTLEQRGYPSIATMGTYGLRYEHIIKELPKSCYICFDMDKNESGQKASLSLGEKLYKYNIDAKIILMPMDMDVNDFFKKYTKKYFNKLVERSILYSTTDHYHKNRNKIYKPKKTKFHNNLDINIAIRTLSITKNTKTTRYQVRCPFHPETKPSFTVYPESNSFYCYSCHKGGTAYHLIKEFYKLNHQETIKKIKEIYKT